MVEHRPLNVARWLPRSAVNGPGDRFVLWLQGCGLGCPGCWNPDTWSFAPRRLLGPTEILALIDAAHPIEGVTLSGGEPFAQAAALLPLARGIRRRGLSLFVYTGHEFEELRSPAAQALLAEIDVLVCGRYREDQRDARLRWRSSTNQRVLFLTDRYGPADIAGSQGEAEVHIAADGRVMITGLPEEELLRALDPP